MVKIPVGGRSKLEAIYKATKGTVVDSEEEYSEFVAEHPLPDGYEWTRSPFGTGEGRWKVSIAQEPDVSSVDTSLERDLGALLEDIGVRDYFQQDYRRFGLQIDFADPDRSVALEPGAVYWHTPGDCHGDSVSDVGGRPDEVYTPATEEDLRKHTTLEKAGWDVLWMTEDGVRTNQDAIIEWLRSRYDW